MKQHGCSFETSQSFVCCASVCSFEHLHVNVACFIVDVERETKLGSVINGEPKVEPQVKPQVESQVKPQVEPQVKPKVEPQVKPQVEPQVEVEAKVERSREVASPPRAEGG